MNDSAQIYGGVSQGFRAPNLDDLTGTQVALNGLGSKGSTSLDPGEFVSMEVGTRFENDTVTGEVAVFYTLTDDPNLRAICGMSSGGLWILQEPYLSFLPDRNFDDVLDGPVEHKIDGFTVKAAHNNVNGLCWGPDGRSW
ncbi:MAG: TonB-dependent receptor [Roseibacillus sp.]|nr:TonB-dependent receptor [Roseibacillus sp.]